MFERAAVFFLERGIGPEVWGRYSIDRLHTLMRLWSEAKERRNEEIRRQRTIHPNLSIQTTTELGLSEFL